MTRRSNAAMQVPALAHYRPWIENLRMEKPYQLDDKLEELFLEKSQTGVPWRSTACSTRPWPACASRWMAKI